MQLEIMSPNIISIHVYAKVLFSQGSVSKYTLFTVVGEVDIFHTRPYISKSFSCYKSAKIIFKNLSRLSRVMTVHFLRLTVYNTAVASLKTYIKKGIVFAF